MGEIDYIPLAFIAGAVFAVTMTVVAVTVAVVATVAAVILPVIAAVTAVVTTVISAIAPILGTIINTIGGIVEIISAGVQGAVEIIKTTIAEPLGNLINGLKTGIADFTAAITEPLAPILNPIKDSLVAIKDFVVEIDAYMKVQLAPVGELIQVLNTVSAVTFVIRLLEGTEDITQVIGEVAEGEAIATAQAIAMLYENITDIGIETIKYTHDTTLALANTIDQYDEKLREDNQLALAMLKDGIDEQVTQVANSLTERITPIETDVTMITRRTEDLPFFQDMLIKALA